MRRSAVRRVAVGALAVAALVCAPSAAVADPASDGFWYFDVTNIQAAHDAGLTGEGVTIVVVDTQINLDVPTLRDADIEVLDSICYNSDGDLVPPTGTDVTATEHATNVVSYLVGSGEGYPGQTGVKGIVPDAKIIFVSTGAPDADGNIECTFTGNELTPSPIGQGMEAAIAADADVISLSVTGSGGGAAEAFTRVLALGIPVLAAVDNSEMDLDGYAFPKIGNGVIGVQSLDADLQVQGGHTDQLTDVCGPGVNLVWQGDDSYDQQRYATGTSLATPIVAGMLGLVAQKYPDATGNQLIQTLIRNTNAEDHELSFDPDHRYGYGVASATHMLKVDPTQYDDVNPLISNDSLYSPTKAEIAAVAEQLKNGDGQTATPGDPSESTASAVPWLPILIGGGVLVLVVAVIVVLAAARRRPTQR